MPCHVLPTEARTTSLQETDVALWAGGPGASVVGGASGQGVEGDHKGRVGEGLRPAPPGPLQPGVWG